VIGEATVREILNLAEAVPHDIRELDAIRMAIATQRKSIAEIANDA